MLACIARRHQYGTLLVDELVEVYAAGSNIIPQMAGELLRIGLSRSAMTSERHEELTMENPIIH